MRLSELVSRLTPATFTVVAMVIFLAAFVVIAFRALRPSARAEHERALRLPLDDGGEP
jgi:cbb3-type cytochrome oxidase subunit 3